MPDAVRRLGLASAIIALEAGEDYKVDATGQSIVLREKYAEATQGKALIYSSAGIPIEVELRQITERREKDPATLQTKLNELADGLIEGRRKKGAEPRKGPKIKISAPLFPRII